MRYAGDMLRVGSTFSDTGDSRREYEIRISEPQGIPLDASDLEITPELTPGGYQGPGFDLLLDQYIKSDPRSGLALLPGGIPGPAQGANIPIKFIDGKVYPDGTQPTGYRPTPFGV